MREVLSSSTRDVLALWISGVWTVCAQTQGAAASRQLDGVVVHEEGTGGGGKGEEQEAPVLQCLHDALRDEERGREGRGLPTARRAVWQSCGGVPQLVLLIISACIILY